MAYFRLEGAYGAKNLANTPWQYQDMVYPEICDVPRVPPTCVDNLYWNQKEYNNLDKTYAFQPQITDAGAVLLNMDSPPPPSDPSN